MALKSLTHLSRARGCHPRLLRFTRKQDQDDVRERSSSQGRKSRRGLKATWAAVYSYVGLPSGVSAALRENLRAPS